jgi:alpha-1,6-mannosyltransferase
VTVLGAPPALTGARQKAAPTRPWWQDPDPDTIRRAGLVGSLMLLIGSFGAGALPTYDPVNHIPVLWSLRRGPGPTIALALVYGGAALLGLAWLHLGRRVRQARTDPEVTGASVPELLRTLAWWGTPLLVAVPLASRDLYSYAAQAQITHAGLDPYTQGPQSSLGPFTDEVGYMWQDTPAPYGPLFLTLGRLVAMLTRDHVVLTVLVMRLVAAGGVLVMMRYLPRLATACGADPRLAVWLALLNPLLLIHFIGGGHNDSVMLALVVAGMTIAVETPAGPRQMGPAGPRQMDRAGARQMGPAGPRQMGRAGPRQMGRAGPRQMDRAGPRDAQRRLAAGVALCTLAMLVKAPALLAIGFLVPVWASRLAGSHRWPRAMLRIGVVAAVTFGIATLAFGLGIGWIRQLNTPGAVVNPLSVPTGLGLLTAVIARVGPYIDSGNPVIGAYRKVFLVVTLGLCGWLWRRTNRWLHPVRALGLALLAVVVLGPVVQPWYLLWPFALLAAAGLTDAAIGAVAGASVALSLLVAPQGTALLLDWAPMLTAAAAGTLATLVVLFDRSPRPGPAEAGEPAAAPATPMSPG